MSMKRPVCLARMLMAVVPFLLSACGRDTLDGSYGRMRGKSVNGTGTFAALMKGEGHTVRTAIRLTPELEEWADVIVRFAPYPGPPEKDEAQWYISWMNADAGRRMIYVPADFDARSDYWREVLDRLPPGTDPKKKTLADRERDQASKWYEKLAPRPKEVGDAADWFAVEIPKGAPEICKKLEGPWAENIKAEDVSLTRHETLKVESETVLLKGDGLPLAIEWSRYNGSQVLVLASGAFVLNGSLLRAARDPLVLRAANWIGEEPANVAFVEGRSVASEETGAPSVFGLLKVPPFGWVVAQLMIMGLVACLARAPRLGRARQAPASDEDRPSAHPEALGSLLARTRQADDARSLLETYRRWRFAVNPLRAGHGPSLDERLEPVPHSELPEHE